MKLLRYFICNNKAVKFEKVNETEVVVFYYDSTLNKFIEDIDYLESVYTAYDSEEVTKEEFDKYIEELRKKNL
jgi:hypothetical protein